MTTTRRLGSIDEISFSAVLSDLDGVVYRGEEAVPGAVDRFNRWQASGVPYCFVTNNAEMPASAFAVKLRGLGIDCDQGQVVTSGDVALNYLQSQFEPGHGVYIIGSQSLKNRVVELGYRLVDVDAAAVLVALDRSFDYAMMKTALSNVLGGARLIGTNPDLIRPIVGGFEPGAGAIAHSIAVSSGAIPVFLGKPEPEILRTAMHRLGISASDAIMLGDKLDTDILAGQRAGVTSVFMETGVPLDTRSAVKPEYILASL